MAGTLDRRSVLGIIATGAAATWAGLWWARRPEDAVTTGRAPTSTAAPATATTASTTSTAAPGTAPTTTTSSTTTTAPPTPRRLEIVCRDGWGAAPPKPGGRPHALGRMTVHHTAVRLDDNGRAAARLRGYQADHQRRGWIDIAYHYGVDAEGTVYELRDPGLAGDTATNYDPAGHFLAVCDGNFEQQDLPAAQREGLVRLLAWASQRFGLDPGTISGHRDHAATSCPGAALYAEITSGRLVDDVTALAAAGPLDAVDCG